jgi:predicted  nucleic acid-binding Zn-ribbon protein
MAAFNQFKEELDKLQSQGDSIDPVLEKLAQEYSKQADEADQLLREKQSIERDRRNLSQNTESG